MNLTRRSLFRGLGALCATAAIPAVATRIVRYESTWKLTDYGRCCTISIKAGSGQDIQRKSLTFPNHYARASLDVYDAVENALVRCLESYYRSRGEQVLLLPS